MTWHAVVADIKSRMHSISSLTASPSLSLGGSKIGAEAMDHKRKEHIAYEYLCHLEEAKK